MHPHKSCATNISLMLTILLILINCGGTSNTAHTSITPPRNEQLDIAYTPPPGGDPLMSKLDVYYIPDGKPKRLMVFIHGGSWVSGDKSNLKTSADGLIQWFLTQGYVVAAPNFRLASAPGQVQTVTYKEQATDIAAALAWLRQNAAQYGVTKQAMLLVGFSSGAHLVPLIASDSSYLQAAGLTLSDIMATISFDIHMYDIAYGLQLMAGSTISANIPLIQFLFGTTAAQQQLASPSFYAPNAAVPPTLLISAEPSLPIGTHGYITSQASQAYMQQLKGLGRQVSWSHFDNETHQSLVTNFGSTGDLPTATVNQFLHALPVVP